ERGDQRARQEQRHGGGEHGAHAQALHEEPGGGDDHGHREHEGGRQPLADDRADRHLGHQHRQRDRQQGLVEDHHEGGDHQHRDDRGDLVGDGGLAVGHRGGGVVGAVAGGLLGLGGCGAAGDDARGLESGELAGGYTG